MGNAVSSSISAERTIAGRIEAAGRQAAQVTVGRLQRDLAALKRDRCHDAGL
ncbi:hypothetical protein [Bradyrhizobium brasilense]|uniref:hypothetical protein n=1 Tax=Bradyrhizobium brasilense TaxID=1419277 RepID=UPI0015A3FE02|nr:hypothetical protein [Bradyrhizobium brasilense]MCC8972031.1 hypothetical protein [Bradyrhizobium brasilense]